MPVRNQFIKGKGMYANFYPPSKPWDMIELTPETSEYYAICVEKYGKALADYYWNRRYSYENERDGTGEWMNLCKEINEKADKFLRSRGIEPFSLK